MLKKFKKICSLEGNKFMNLEIENGETLIARTKTSPTFGEMREFLEARVNTVDALEESRQVPDRPPRPARTA